MPHQSIRSAVNKLVAFFQRDSATPVAPERSSCPNSEGEANNAQNGAGPGHCFCVRNDASTERMWQSVAVDQEKIRYYQQYPVTEPLCPALATDRTFGRCRRHYPDDHKREPTSINDIDR